MNLTRAVSDYLDGLSNARLVLRAPSVGVPFAAFAVVQCLILMAFASFTADSLAPIMVPLVRALGGEEALHYPLNFVQLPGYYQRVYLPLVATVGFGLWTLGVWTMVDHHVVGAKRARQSYRRALPHVLAVGILFTGASVVTGVLAASFVGEKTPPAAATAIVLVSILVTATAQAFLVYAPVALRLRAAGVWDAVRAGAAYARRRFLATAMLMATVLFIHVPLDFLLARADRVAARFQPEAVLYLLLGSAILEMVTAYLMFAATTELALPSEGGLR